MAKVRSPLTRFIPTHFVRAERPVWDESDAADWRNWRQVEDEHVDELLAMLRLAVEKTDATVRCPAGIRYVESYFDPDSRYFVAHVVKDNNDKRYVAVWVEFVIGCGSHAHLQYQGDDHA